MFRHLKNLRNFCPLDTHLVYKRLLFSFVIFRILLFVIFVFNFLVHQKPLLTDIEDFAGWQMFRWQYHLFRCCLET